MNDKDDLYWLDKQRKTIQNHPKYSSSINDLFIKDCCNSKFIEGSADFSQINYIGIRGNKVFLV